MDALTVEKMIKDVIKQFQSSMPEPRLFLTRLDEACEIIYGNADALGEPDGEWVRLDDVFEIVKGFKAGASITYACILDDLGKLPRLAPSTRIAEALMDAGLAHFDAEDCTIPERVIECYDARIKELEAELTDITKLVEAIPYAPKNLLAIDVVNWMIDTIKDKDCELTRKEASDD